MTSENVMVLIHLVLIASPLALLRDKEKLYPAMVFSLAVGLHAAVYLNTEFLCGSPLYYLSDFSVMGGAALIVMALGTSRFNLYLAGLLLVACAGDMYGWVLFETGACPTPYNNLFIAIYLSAVFVMLTGGKNGWKNYLPRVRAFSFRRSARLVGENIPGLLRKERS